MIRMKYIWYSFNLDWFWQNRISSSRYRKPLAGRSRRSWGGFSVSTISTVMDTLANLKWLACKFLNFSNNFWDCFKWYFSLNPPQGYGHFRHAGKTRSPGRRRSNSVQAHRSDLPRTLCYLISNIFFISSRLCLLTSSSSGDCCWPNPFLRDEAIRDDAAKKDKSAKAVFIDIQSLWFVNELHK